MSFNYGREWKKFVEDQKQLKKEYEAVGMSQEAIQILYEYDLEWFRSCRNEMLHRVSPQKMMSFDSSTGDFLYMDMDELLVKEPLVTSIDRYAWIDELENVELLDVTRSVKPDYIEIITLLMEGYQQNDIAVLMHSSFRAINNKIARIRNLFKEFVV